MSTDTKAGAYYLDKRGSRLQEVLLALRLGTFLVPINNSLIRDTVLVVQHLLPPSVTIQKRRQQ